MIDYCYHTHTTRCGHASGTDEEYVLSAIEKGYKVIGFTDHIFLPNVIQDGMRGRYEELDDYINSINHLKEKYKDKIEIHLGFECEYGGKYKEYYQHLKKEKGIEYLILGQHLFFEGNELVWLSQYGSPEDILTHYVDIVTQAIESGLFTYIAHPDICLRFFEKFDPFVETHIRRLCECVEKHHIPLELNLGSRRDHQRRRDRMDYPDETFFKIVSEYSIPIIIGVDAHNPRDFDPSVTDIPYAEDLAKRLNLKLINRINLNK